ncbi:MAG: stage IV sporulation protein A [Clostridia bacterium]|nr:stage IV sporulation protein A [Clostridia bacterium]
MTDMGIYGDIATRTGGDIYIGVVGPVRTGKSTLIKRFTENLILPNIGSEGERERAKDEMPQSASGKTVMTTEPKFIPENAVSIPLDENTDCKVKLIDCVGYIVPGAMGLIEDGRPRMVMTPWAEDPLPFEKAAETGTRKVIEEHSTVGIVVTTDGSVGELPRESYVEAEKRVITELKTIKKPFVVVLNCAHPSASASLALAESLEQEYDVPVLPINCLEMSESDIKDILRGLLYEFPVREVRFGLPAWLDVLEDGDDLKKELFSDISECVGGLKRVGEIREAAECFKSGSDISARLDRLELGSGSARIDIRIPERVFYSILGEKSGFDIENERSLLKIMTELADVKRKYDKVASAIDDVMNDGYGIVMPSIDDLTLEEPEIVKQPGGYGVKLKASAPSIHMMKADIETEVNPIVGTESQSEELVSFLLKEFEEDPKSIWESNMFGKSLHELVSENLNSKLAHMPDDARAKIAGTIQRIINEGSGGLICILL